ncbi:MAG TPA: hypothetical protein PLJ44_09605 [Victivallales bacterium]|nr:hypothetical protein [Victivallales bacterium]
MIKKENESASIVEADIVNYSYKMIRILMRRYCEKFRNLLYDKDELESELLLQIARIVDRHRKKPLDYRWKRYCKVAIQMGIRTYLKKLQKKEKLYQKLRRLNKLNQQEKQSSFCSDL